MANFNGFLRSDLASELVKTTSKVLDERITREEVRLNRAQAKEINKREGEYISFTSPIALEGNFALFSRLSNALAVDIKRLIRGKRLLVIGLGNPSLSSDSLGPKTVEKLSVSDNLLSFCPLVSGLTGIESFDLCKAVAREVNPDTVLCVDSLCAADRKRIATVFQLTDTGIIPGSGVGNHQRALDRETLGVQTLSLGVPLVVYLSTLIREAGGDENLSDPELIVTPKEVDVLVENCAEILASAIASAVN